MKESFIFLFAILGVLLGYQGIKRNEYILVLNKDDTSLLPPNMQLRIKYQAMESTMKSSSHFGEHALESSSKLRDYVSESSIHSIHQSSRNDPSNKPSLINIPSDKPSSLNIPSDKPSSLTIPSDKPSSLTPITPTKKYIWKNNTKYNLLCSRIHTKDLSSSSVLVFDYWYQSQKSGFGCMLHSLITAIAVSIVGNYKVHFIYPQYSSLFDGCFSDRIIPDMSAFRYHKLCLPLNNCFNWRLWRIGDNIKNKSIYTYGHDMSPDKIIQNSEYYGVWEELFKGTGVDVNSWNIRKELIRLFLNPKEDLVKELEEERERIIKYKHTIGVQLRMGGTVADVKEYHYWGLPFSRLDDVITQIKEEITKHHWDHDVQVYISSDSSMAIEYMRNHTKGDFPVVESTLYKRGHSRGVSSEGKYVSVVKKILSDFYFMSKSDKVLVSWQSLLGRMMCYMMEEYQCDQVLHWKKASKYKPIPKHSKK